MSYPPTTTPLTPLTSATSSLTPPIPVPTHGPDGSFAILAKTLIAAPPYAVLAAIRNTNTWNKWNTFCPHCILIPTSKNTPLPPPDTQEQHKDDAIATSPEQGWLNLGSTATISVFMNGDGLEEGKTQSRTQGIVITRLGLLEAYDVEMGREGEGESRRGYVIAWKSTGWAHWQLHSERVMEFVEGKDGGTVYVCWETFGGVLGAVVRRMVGGTLVERFGDYARDVKGFLEGGSAVLGRSAGSVVEGT